MVALVRRLFRSTAATASRVECRFISSAGRTAPGRESRICSSDLQNAKRRAGRHTSLRPL